MDIWFTLNALHCDAANRGMNELAEAYFKSSVRMGFEIIDSFRHNTRSIYDQMDRDLGDMIK